MGKEKDKDGKPKGFLKKALDGDEADSGRYQEEMYERLFMKIGRDFVTKEDFSNILREVLGEIRDALGRPDSLLGINLDDNSAALQRAEIYSGFIDKTFDGSRVYPDLIVLED